MNFLVSTVSEVSSPSPAGGKYLRGVKYLKKCEKNAQYFRYIDSQYTILSVNKATCIVYQKNITSTPTNDAHSRYLP